jgi:serine/threonine protein kinase
MNERVIFFEALDRTDPTERAAYLVKACSGDPDLRNRVEALLRSHAVAGEFLEMPAPQQLASPPGSLADDEHANAAQSSSNPRTECEIPLDLLAPSSRPDALGRLGHYEILGVVGQGGMGIVLRAFDETLHRVVAIKMLAPGLATTGSARQRFVREARAAAAIAHENVIGIHAVEDQGPVPFLVMEYIDGPTLQQKLDRTGPLPLKEVVRIGMQIAAGLAAAHRQGLVHRDVKPSNILLENGVERVKITDFGLARAVDDASLTHSGLVAGTPSYMSPEQADGRHVDQRSDLFSLGSVLYTLCAGHGPFRASTSMAVLRRVCDETPRDLSEINSEVPAWLATIVARLHAKDPAERFRSAAEVSELLAQYLANLQHPDRVPAPASPSSQRRRSSPWKLPAVAIIALVAGLSAAAAAGLADIPDAVIRLISPDATLVVQKKPDPPNEAESWERSISRLPAEKQVAAVARRLQMLNPGFDGKLEVCIDKGLVKSLKVRTDHLRDITPLRALRAIMSLDLVGTYPLRGKLSDLSSLRGLPLERLNFCSSGVVSLEPLRGMKLRKLHCGETGITDLSPLKGMKLTFFTAQRTRITDLEPLRGMPLIWLDLYGAIGVSDLGPLEGMPLTYLNVGDTFVSDVSVVAGLKSLRQLVLDDSSVSDLSPLRGLKLEELSFARNDVTDLSPIRDLPLRKLRLDFKPDYAAFLRSLRGLQVLNERPVAQFWKDDSIARAAEPAHRSAAAGRLRSSLVGRILNPSQYQQSFREIQRFGRD